jgi:hypothetical protein
MYSRVATALLGLALYFLVGPFPLALAFTQGNAGDSIHYDYCVCHFGYEVCQVNVACEAGGGRCGKTCSPDAETTGTTGTTRTKGTRGTKGK